MDFYKIEEIENELEQDSIGWEEAGFMVGYLEAYE